MLLYYYIYTHEGIICYLLIKVNAMNIFSKMFGSFKIIA
jgi:hypothetical protein